MFVCYYFSLSSLRRNINSFHYYGDGVGDLMVNQLYSQADGSLLRAYYFMLLPNLQLDVSGPIAKTKL